MHIANPTDTSATSSSTKPKDQHADAPVSRRPPVPYLFVSSLQLQKASFNNQFNSTMAPLSTLFTSAALLATGASAFSPASHSSAVRPATNLYENFGFDFAEDQVENTPQIILGEANYKKWVNSVDPDNMLNRQVSYLLVYNAQWKFVLWSGRILFCWIIPNDSKE